MYEIGQTTIYHNYMWQGKQQRELVFKSKNLPKIVKRIRMYMNTYEQTPEHYHTIYLNDRLVSPDRFLNEVKRRHLVIRQDASGDTYLSTSTRITGRPKKSK